jgi:hypothetical protein
VINKAKSLSDLEAVKAVMKNAIQRTTSTVLPKAEEAILMEQVYDLIKQ